MEIFMKCCFLGAIAILAVDNVAGQKLFSTKIYYPEKLMNKIEIGYENGKNSKSVIIPKNQNYVEISDSFYSRYATIMISYPDPNNYTKYLSRVFWISESPSSITFYDDSLTENYLKKFKVINGYLISDFGGDKLEKFTSLEDSSYSTFFLEFMKNPVKTDSLRALLTAKIKLLLNKELEFIKTNSDLYFSFWIFRTQITGAGILNADSILKFYLITFPDSLKKSFEGEEILKTLRGRMEAKVGNRAPEFSVTDTKGDVVSIAKFAGRYILLDFWASWCKPCIKEIPRLREIALQYPKKDLEIISITLDQDFELFNKSVIANGLNWRLIYNSSEIIKKYGIGPIPQLFLIDRNGMIVYSMEESNDPELKYLQEYLKNNIH